MVLLWYLSTLGFCISTGGVEHGRQPDFFRLEPDADVRRADVLTAHQHDDVGLVETLSEKSVVLLADVLRPLMCSILTDVYNHIRSWDADLEDFLETTDLADGRGHLRAKLWKMERGGVEVVAKEVSPSRKMLEEAAPGMLGLPFVMHVASLFSDPPAFVIRFQQHGSLHDEIKRRCEGELVNGQCPAGQYRSPGPAEVATLMGQMALGMYVLHLHGVIHRDIKPHNALLGERNNLQLIDFGIAHFGCPVRSANGCTKGQPGTPEFSHPARAQGRAYAFEVDWHAWAKTAHMVLSGRLGDPVSDDVLGVLEDTWSPELRAAWKDMNGDALEQTPRPVWTSPELAQHPVLGHRFWLLVENDGTEDAIRNYWERMCRKHCAVCMWGRVAPPQFPITVTRQCPLSEDSYSVRITAEAWKYQSEVQSN